jgi:hypothetical protein
LQQVSLSLSLSLSLFLCCSHFGDRASVKRFVSLQFLNLGHSVGLLGRGDQPVARPIPTQTQNKRKQTSMPWVGFEPTIPLFEQAKTFHALDRAVTVIASHLTNPSQFNHPNDKERH